MELLRTRLRRSSANQVVTGVLGGLADFCGLSARKVRIAWFIGTLLSGGLLIGAYLLLWYVMPDDLG